jgi:hypothetical protein
MQSVMKLIAGMAVMDAADHCQLHLQDAIVAWREDLSLIRAAHRRACGPAGQATSAMTARYH